MSDIQRLFDLDPLSLTRDNLDEVIEYYRKARAQWATKLSTARQGHE